MHRFRLGPTLVTITFALSLLVHSPRVLAAEDDGSALSTWGPPVAGIVGATAGAIIMGAGAAAGTYLTCPTIGCPNETGKDTPDWAVYITAVPTAALLGGAFGGMLGVYIALLVGADE